ncbi:MAG TPA: DNA translocase FtsK, partial [Candidatus Nanoarchaeia archaeon]|nr:DNA translocase FtsK [Candidatus Nanoarchaeia archaeon]
DLLEATSTKADAGNIKQNAGTIQSTLASFGIEVAMSEVNVGPTVTQYTLKPESGVKLNKITALEHNLSLSLAAHPLRVEAPIPGKSAVGIEVPNKTSAIVRMKDLLTSKEFEAAKSPLEFVLGRDVSGTPAVADLAKMPHLLIAGATGSGKSVMINTFLTSLLYRNSPSNLKLILVDPKRVELTLYNDIPHLLTPVIVEPEKCISALRWAVAEMERRYKLFSEVGKRNIGDYNQAKKEEAMPYIVIVIDELADLMSIAAQDVEALVVRLAQMARATGIHLVLATQRPSVNVITGLIKANIPARIAFSVASQFDSRTILDQGGAEKLLGKGDMLFSSPELPKPRRLQGAMISDKETKAVTDYLRDARAPQYNEEVLTQPGKGSGGRSGGFDMEDVDDDLFEEAADTVIRSGKASASLLQRRLRVGYARAARLLDILEERGVVGPPDGARPRDVLVSSMSDVNGGGAPPDEGFGEQ